MNEQKRDLTHHEDATTTTEGARGCDRAEELVAHLYGEATPEEEASFTRHLRACAVCRDELSAFANVREMVAAERADALGAAPLLDVGELLAGRVNKVNAASTLPSHAPRARSAVAALREFFALSPLWLRAGAVAASLLVCALAALVVARAEVRWDENGLAFSTGGGERVVEKRVEVPVQTGFTREQLDAMVAERLKDERAAMNRELQQARDAASAAAAEVAAIRKKSAPRVLVASEGQRTQPRKRGVQSNTRRNEQQLAEDDLPRLSDLLGGAY